MSPGAVHCALRLTRRCTVYAQAKALERESGGETEATELQREADEKVTLALTRPSAKDDKLPLPTLGKGSSLFKPDRPSPLAGAMNGKKDAKDRCVLTAPHVGRVALLMCRTQQ